eukprot:CAMPEP_0175782600 /NCGR_PEP_ID=MMETSP0097-20121207/77867_1 /TAXON_ID=311494 /ORGANISM="Alexandrium monilatum, Strain CCMP3105" /LENGTH=34 /DNA_ID= /DNA_START= /DNA_END= /DNA_ORIENTATION=
MEPDRDLASARALAEPGPAGPPLAALAVGLEEVQ